MQTRPKSCLIIFKKNTYLKAKEICKHVKDSYGITYSVPGMIAWLKDHDFVYKQPLKVPGKLDPTKQEAFIEKYEELKRSIPADHETYFLDAVHPEFQSQVVRSVDCLEASDKAAKFDALTDLTTYSSGGKSYSRYFHSQASIKEHLSLAGFTVKHMNAYQEQLCVDFQRTKPSSQIDSLIEVVAVK